MRRRRRHFGGSAAFAPVIITPSESLGSNLIANGVMTLPTTPWSVGAGWAMASGVATHSAGTGSAFFQPVASSAGKIIEHRMQITTISAGTISQRVGNSLVGRTVAGLIRALMHRPDSNVNDGAQASADAAGSIDNLSEQTITINAQATAPSANMKLSVYYTLPGTPDIGTQIWLLPRISAWASGNYWVAVLEYTGTWDITLYSVASYVRSARIATVTNVGVTNGMQINLVDAAISLYTSADAGATWTQCGGTITNNTYQTAADVNTIWTSDITVSSMVIVPP